MSEWIRAERERDAERDAELSRIQAELRECKMREEEVDTRLEQEEQMRLQQENARRLQQKHLRLRLELESYYRDQSTREPSSRLRSGENSGRPLNLSIPLERTPDVDVSVALEECTDLLNHELRQFIATNAKNFAQTFLSQNPTTPLSVDEIAALYAFNERVCRFTLLVHFRLLFDVH